MEMNGAGVSLSSLLDSDEAEFEITRKGSVEGSGWFITLAGPGHERTIASQNITSRRAIRRQAQIEAATVNGRKYKPPEADPEEEKRQTIASIVGRIVDWRGLTDDAGQEIKFSDKTGMELLSNPQLQWVFGQIVDALTDERFYETLRESVRDYAERDFALNSPEDNGRTYRQVIEDLLDRAERRGDLARVAEMEAELALPAFPKGLEYVWRAFWRLRRRKGGSGFGISPIEWPDIDAFVRNSRMKLSPWEIEIIEMLDDVFLAEHAKRTAKKSDAGHNKD